MSTIPYSFLSLLASPSGNGGDFLNNNFKAIANSTLRGNIIYVDAETGNDSTGRRGDVAWPFASPNAAAAVAQSGDLIQLSSGTFNISSFVSINGVTGQLAIPANVSISGTGIFETIIYSSVCSIGNGSGEGTPPSAIYVPGNNTETRNLQIKGSTTANQYCAPIGFFSATDTIATYARFVNVSTLAWSDGIMGNDTVSGQVWDFVNCEFNSNYDTFNYNFSGVMTFNFWNCKFSSTNSSSTNETRCIADDGSGAGIVNLFECTLNATNYSTNTPSAIYAYNRGTYYIFGGIITASGGNNPQTINTDNGTSKVYVSNQTEIDWSIATNPAGDIFPLGMQLNTTTGTPDTLNILPGYPGQTCYTVSGGNSSFYIGFRTDGTGTESTWKHIITSDGQGTGNISLTGTMTAKSVALLGSASAGLMEYNGTFYETNNKTIRYSKGGTIFNHYVDSPSSGASETTLYSDTTLGNTLVNDGDKIVADYAGTFSSTSSATKTVRTYFAGTKIYDSGALTSNASGNWKLSVIIVCDTSTSVRAVVSFSADGISSTVSSPTVTKITGLTLTSTNTLYCSGQSGGSGEASGDITAILGVVYFYPAC